MFATAGTDNFSFRGTLDIPSVAFGDDALYVTICSTACNDGLESVTLYRVDSPGMGFEYPRSEIIQAYHSRLNYVALGDSFSSGEGVEPFYEGTNISPDVNPVDPNMCHRSKKAYPELLANTPGSGLRLQAFVACSGAVMDDVTSSGQYNEPAQTDALSAGTDLVTITIGGNDLGFESVAKTCNLDNDSVNCLAALNASIAEAQSTGFEDDLTDTLEQVRTAAPNARIIVLGYPYVLSTPETLAWCGWATQVSTQQEREAVEDLIFSLDAALNQATAEVSNAAYVDSREAFHGHYVCNDVKYINGAVITNEIYSYHPTEKGQEELAGLVLSEVG